MEPDHLPLHAHTIRAAPADQVARLMLQALRPARAGTAPPRWLRPHQHDAFQRLVACVERFGGGMLADPVGTGKTWVALAAAQALSARPVACVVPSVLRAQWSQVAARTGVCVKLASHAQASRGRLPPLQDLAIIDESHHYRNAGILRYRHVARWLVGHRAILLTATPVVNRPGDLVHQLLLALPDDCLAPFGVVSLAAAAGSSLLPEPITRVVIRTPARGPVPSRQTGVIRPRMNRTASHILRAVDALQYSESPPVRRLVLGVLWQALASSPAALSAALRRYCLLLEASRDAAGAGCMLDRATIRRWAGADHDQLVLWSLLGEQQQQEAFALCHADAEEARRIVGQLRSLEPAQDPKLRALSGLVSDGVPTVVFCAARATVHWLRKGLGYQRTAWCTGRSAGIGVQPWRVDALLSLYGRSATSRPAPALLLCTDVAAEGLDLQRIVRVVHYDLPWTPARMEQRVGRAARLGSVAPVVDIVRFEIPASLERRLRTGQALRRKARLIDLALETIEEGDANGGSVPLIAGTGALVGRTTARGPGVLAAFAIAGVDDAGARVHGNRLVWLGAGAPRNDRMMILPPLLAAMRNPGVEMAGHVIAPEIEQELRRLTAELNGWLWARPARATHAGLVARLRQWRRDALRRRDAVFADRVGNALRLLSRGRTAGEDLLLDDLARHDDPARLDRLPRARAIQRFEVTLVGALEVDVG